MKLTIDFNSNSSTFSLNTDIDIDINRAGDVKGLAYISLAMVCMTAQLENLVHSLNPNQTPEVEKGAMKALQEKLSENNPVWPFTTFIKTDE